MTPKSKKELAAAYNISHVTLIRWLKSIYGLAYNKKEKFLLPFQLEKIYSIYGNPFKNDANKDNNSSS